jgi:multiple antibiotic resistance protein
MDHLVQAIAAILAITNPLGAAPVFVALTDELQPAQRRREAFRAALVVLVILVVAALVGRWILRAFGVSVPAFQAAGGLVIVLMGLEMLRGSPSRVQHDPQAGPVEGDPIIVPFAMPLIAGPGAITTVITLASRGHGWPSLVEPIVGVIVAALALTASLLSSTWLEERVKHHGHGLFLRFMGLILVAIGAQLLLSGVTSFQAGPGI